MTDFAWLIEAPGARYLGTREIAHFPEFFWTTDHAKATRFHSEQQADGVMMALRRMEPALFAFAVNLGDARPVEHGWMNRPKEQVVGLTPTEKMGPSLESVARSKAARPATPPGPPDPPRIPPRRVA